LSRLELSQCDGAEREAGREATAEQVRVAQNLSRIRARRQTFDEQLAVPLCVVSSSSRHPEPSQSAASAAQSAFRAPPRRFIIEMAECRDRTAAAPALDDAALSVPASVPTIQRVLAAIHLRFLERVAKTYLTWTVSAVDEQIFRRREAAASSYSPS
jgi:hypothetical protein